ncbi:hypothetical protein [Subtercola lobariae]|uniref:Uncharacterized protein n=1 Tax=Subtercola lobariae TaxID=1588641 RepID=A0A917B784_9MICO|nr:hypothetical protein [Subtercola lobariae]GGF28929.1 hypothetical protein GCM10011399_22560 [Subtercola lobariae]
MPSSSVPDFASNDDLFDEQAAKFDVSPHDETNGAGVTEGWADAQGNPAHHHVDFIEDEQVALGLSGNGNIPDDQKKAFPFVTVIAIGLFVLAVAAIAVFVVAR